MRVLLCCLVLCLFVIRVLHAQQVYSAKKLKRNSKLGLKYAGFIMDKFHYLNVSQVGSALVLSPSLCGEACLAVMSCFSFNLAAYAHVDGKLLCELLATDKYNESQRFHANELSHHFSIFSPCSKKPCQNGGKCIALYEYGEYKCDCPSGFDGKTCNGGSLATSCSDLKKKDSSLTNGNYVIDPDGAGGLAPFSVFCDMSDKAGVGVTVISHDSEDRTLVDGCDAPGCYSRDVTYTGASLAQLANLTRVSSHCEQFIKYECCNARLLWSDSYDYGWLVSRDGFEMAYWGGASPGSNKCACGMNESCAVSYRYCNCDTKDNVWREDSGLLTHKSDLPVSQLRFGDVGTANPHDKKGYHTLGKLKCVGVI